MTVIIESDEISSLEKVYYKIIREEDRLNSAKNREQQQEAAGFLIRRETHSEPQRESRELACNIYQFDSSETEGNRVGGRLCFHCDHFGQDKSLCWQLVGYPEWMYNHNLMQPVLMLQLHPN